MLAIKWLVQSLNDDNFHKAVVRVPSIVQEFDEHQQLLCY